MDECVLASLLVRALPFASFEILPLLPGPESPIYALPSGLIMKSLATPIASSESDAPPTYAYFILAANRYHEGGLDSQPLLTATKKRRIIHAARSAPRSPSRRIRRYCPGTRRLSRLCTRFRRPSASLLCIIEARKWGRGRCAYVRLEECKQSTIVRGMSSHPHICAIVTSRHSKNY